MLHKAIRTKYAYQISNKIYRHINKDSVIKTLTKGIYKTLSTRLLSLTLHQYNSLLCIDDFYDDFHYRNEKSSFFDILYL